MDAPEIFEKSSRRRVCSAFTLHTEAQARHNRIRGLTQATSHKPQATSHSQLAESEIRSYLKSKLLAKR